nr:hypothetical protein [Tanacetum cinerariifolium]
MERAKENVLDAKIQIIACNTPPTQTIILSALPAGSRLCFVALMLRLLGRSPKTVLLSHEHAQLPVPKNSTRSRPQNALCHCKANVIL